MATVPLEWRISQTGAESVKARFQELKQQLDSGAISQEQYSKGVKNLRKEINDLTASQRLNKQIFEASHPTLVNFGRAMSAVGSVMSASVSALNSIHLAQLAWAGTNSQIAEQQNKVSQAQRDYNDAVRLFGKDSPQAKDALGAWNVEQQKLKEMNENTKQEDIDKMATIASNIALIGTSAATAAPKLSSVLPFLPLAGRFAALFAGSFIEPMITHPGEDPFAVQNERTKKALDNLQALLTTTYSNINAGLTALSLVLTGIWNGIVRAFNSAWKSITTGFTAFWNGFATIANVAMKGIADGITGFINGIIAAVEAALSALSRLTGGGGVSLPRINVAAPQIPLIAAANGFNGEVTSPHLLLVGEAGPEHVSVTPGTNSVSTSNSISNSAATVNHYHIAGSVWSFRELSRALDQSNKRELGRRNFRPFG